VLITLGNAISAENLKLPANVVAVPFVPHAAVIPQAQLVVTHAGHGTVMEAALAGIPLLCTPMGRDQHAVSACVDRCGIGASMPATASASELEHKIDGLLNDARLRARCAQFAASLNLERGLRRAIEVLDHI
jgi:UDP:flavonoid glycosyltransferase YjiC (YdhE family)